MNFSIDIEGFEDVIAHIQKMEDSVKSKELKKIFVRQAQPILDTMRSKAPIATRSIKYTNKSGSTKIPPGNLRKSLKKFKGRSEEFPSVYVGPKVKKSGKTVEDSVIGSGWYGYFVNYGKGKIRKGGKHYHYLQRTYSLVAATVGNRATEKTIKYLQKLERQLGFEVVR